MNNNKVNGGTKMIKKTIVAVIVAMCAVMCMARPGPGPGGFGPRPPVHHHHSSFWGRGGRNFWPGFVGGVVGSALYSGVYRSYPSTVVYSSSPTVVTTTPIVTPMPVVVQQPVVVQPQPVYTTQQVWVEGCWVNQVQANGAVVRVYQPGHYETRQVRVQ